jgi:SAM-dependent methyltransferase
MTDPITSELVPPLLPTYTPLEKLQVSRPCDRFDAIRKLCKGRSVLDLGAMDETAFQAKRGRGTWLHEEIASVAAKVVGIDSSPLLHADGMQTAPNAKIYPGDIMSLDLWLEEGPLYATFDPDVIVAGELIEHLHNPLLFLQKIKAIDRLRGKLLVLTTPNATAVHNCIIGLTSRESTHHDHLCILSYKTLSTLCNRAGFSDWIITPYYARFEEMKARQKGFGKPLVAAGEMIVNGLEWMFPLMSFGYTVTITI